MRPLLKGGRMSPGLEVGLATGERKAHCAPHSAAARTSASLCADTPSGPANASRSAGQSAIDERCKPIPCAAAIRRASAHFSCRTSDPSRGKRGRKLETSRSISSPGSSGSRSTTRTLSSRARAIQDACSKAVAPSAGTPGLKTTSVGVVAPWLAVSATSARRAMRLCVNMTYAIHKGQDNRTNIPKRDTDGSDQSSHSTL